MTASGRPLAQAAPIREPRAVSETPNHCHPLMYSAADARSAGSLDRSPGSGNFPLVSFRRGIGRSQPRAYHGTFHARASCCIVDGAGATAADRARVCARPASPQRAGSLMSLAEVSVHLLSNVRVPDGCRELSAAGRLRAVGDDDQQATQDICAMKDFASSSMGALSLSRAKQNKIVSDTQPKTITRGNATKKLMAAATTERIAGSSTKVSFAGSLYVSTRVTTRYVTAPPKAVIAAAPASSKMKAAPSIVTTVVASCVSTDRACRAAVQKQLELIAMSMYANLFSIFRNRSKQATTQAITQASAAATALPDSFMPWVIHCKTIRIARVTAMMREPNASDPMWYRNTAQYAFGKPAMPAKVNSLKNHSCVT
mmetsp:Transcript_21459/g.61253  ORF Transcript_21459/g.61253 Transcript_21459/m.61253 type:complete len:371 (+) Transcript_21459:108-1220(+)